MSEDLRRQHSERFREISTRYPRRVAEAYDGDIARAAADDDETVAATVAAWEREHGLPVRDWYAIGREEQDVIRPQVVIETPPVKDYTAKVIKS